MEHFDKRMATAVIEDAPRILIRLMVVAWQPDYAALFICTV